MAHGEDNALTRVAADARRHWFGIAVQRFGQVSALSQFLLGPWDSEEHDLPRHDG